MPPSQVPDCRIRAIARADRVDAGGDFVLYWMIAFRRTRHNFSLQRAADWAQHLGKPLIVLEALRCGYRWASDRLHQFVIEGMADNAADLADLDVHYYPYLEPENGAGKGLLRSLAERASVVVSDDFPCFFLPRMVDAAARQVPVRLELVDSNGLLPMRAAEQVFSRAYSFRRFLQKNLRPHLKEFPQHYPVSRIKLPRLDGLPPEILSNWPPARPERFANREEPLTEFPLDHDVPPAPTRGGRKAGEEMLKTFLNDKLPRYDQDRNDPDADATSGLSPYLHFGHIAAHQVFADLMDDAGWSPDALAEKATGSREGWWNAPPAVESFLDELITWRELGYNMCTRRDDYDQYESLPDWARETLAVHTADQRPHIYTRKEFERADTHDELWNAAQRQLVREGRIHNYLRMLWGKKILHWSESPQEALEIMIELNNKYGLDGRNPNSYSGIFWVLGRYDRAWGPEREVFGKIRYMTSDSARRKLKLKRYLERFGDDSVPTREDMLF